MRLPQTREPIMTDTYTLDENGIAVEEPDRSAWGRWMQQPDQRFVAQANVQHVLVSTVFLGLDHSFGDGPPLLFETMIFGGKHDQYQERYSTRTEALMGHMRAFRLVQHSLRR